MHHYRDLLAVCVEGVLLDDEGHVTAEDVRALSRLREHDVAIVLVSVRMPSALLPIARRIGADAPMVCGDGAVVVEPTRGSVLGRRTLSQPATALGGEILRGSPLAQIALTTRSIHGDPESASLAEAALGTARIEGLAWSADPPARRDVCALFGVGELEAARAIETEWARHDVTSADASAQPIPEADGSLGAVRILPRAQSRARALGAIAARLGIERRRAAYVGGRAGPFEDRSGFEWAASAFCRSPLPPELAGIAQPLPTNGGTLQSLAVVWP